LIEVVSGVLLTMSLYSLLWRAIADLVPRLICAAFLYVVYAMVYRLYLSPIAHLPGPKLAALTTLYEFYYDFIHLGQFYFQLERLHQQYGRLWHVANFVAENAERSAYPVTDFVPYQGPIVRIGPNEVHIADPDYFERIYNVTTKFEKYKWYYRFLNIPDSTIPTSAADLHRRRRGAFSKYLSAAGIAKIDPIIKKSVGTLCRRVGEHREADEIIDLGNAYRCLAADVISDYVLPAAPTFLEAKHFAAGYNEVLRNALILALLNRHLGWLFPLVLAMPRWLVFGTSPTPVVAVYDNLKVHISSPWCMRS
jgi:hypothetical protein